MIKRTVEISQEPAHLSVRMDQLVLQRRGPDQPPLASIPCEDVGVVLVDHPSATYSHAALATLMDFGAVVVICGRDHLPVGMLLPLERHTEVVWRIRDQIAAGKPLRKRLWKQLVVAKVRAQAANLPSGSATRSKLLTLAREVRSGDPENVESQAARLYWSAWLDDATAFRRDPDAGGLNAMLNYGYAVVRAAVARAIVAAGLHPTLGIRHSSRSNAFCLADDLMEPLRPLVDDRVRELRRQGQEELNPEGKRGLLGILADPVRLEDQTGPLMVALHRMVASLVHCYQGSAARLLVPLAAEPETC